MDDFHNPQPHDAASKTTVSSVLNSISSAGLGVLSLLSGLLAAVMLLYSGYVLYDSAYTQNRAFSSSWDMLQYKPNIVSDPATPIAGQDTLAAINQDYRAWLTMYDTKIDYPVMQGEDNLYYANHDIYKQSSLTGALYLASGNSADLSDGYNLIYGHHMENGAMFGALDLYLDAAYRDSHLEGILVSPTGVFDLEVFAVAETDAYEQHIYYVGSGKTAADVISFLENPSAKTDVRYYNAAAAQDATKITALSTCASAETNGRLVVFCKTTQRNLLKLTVTDYEADYDALQHGLGVETNYPGGTVIEYSTDGGVTWSEQPTTRKDAGTTAVLVRATNDIYGRDTVEATITVRPLAVTVEAVAAGKVYGTQDPSFSAVPVGLVDDYVLAYSVSRPGAGSDENAGVYNDAIVPAGDAAQGNYTVSYSPADFEISPAPMGVVATDYNGAYDGAAHSAVARPSVTEGTVLSYSTDGGLTWSSTPPSIKDVGSVDFTVRATNPNYVTATATGTLSVTQRAVTVAANPASKVCGQADPSFTATVTGTVGSDTVSYTVTRPGAGSDEDVAVYNDAIIVSGEQSQGNYAVTFEPADFEITSSAVLTVTGISYEGVYDGARHSAKATVNVTAGTTVEYSTDGQNWSTAAPSITDVGSLRVYVRARNRNYNTATAQLTLTVTPRQVTVTADNAVKLYGSADPVFTATVNGLLNRDTVNYTVALKGKAENAGTYPDHIVPNGAARQGNYAVTYVAGDYTVLPTAMTLSVGETEFVYDGEVHTITAGTDVTEGTVIEYSTDGGETWSTKAPEIRDVGEITVQVRATNPNHVTQTEELVLSVKPRHVTVTVNGASKLHNDEDPVFTASEEGLIDDFKLVYEIRRTNRDEAPGNYKDVIVAEGAAEQGNYVVTYVPGSFTIFTTDAPAPEKTDEPGTPDDTQKGEETEELEDSNVPFTHFFERFKPQEGSGAAWAIVNLICLIATIYLTLPLFHLRDKFGRAKIMKAFNADKLGLRDARDLDAEDEEIRSRIENTALEAREKKSKAADGPVSEGEFGEAVQSLYYKLNRFLKRFWVGFGGEVAVSVLALLWFIWTEDMRTPMTLIDKWTPLMVLFLAMNWVLDIRLARYRDKSRTDKTQEEQTAASV